METKKQNNEQFHFGVDYLEAKTIQTLRLVFERHGYVKLPGFIPLSTFNVLKGAVQNLLPYAVQRNFVMNGYESPRIMTTIGGPQINDYSPLIKEFYQNQKLRSILSGIIGTQVYDSFDEYEWCVSTWLNGEGQTHGHHLDDPPIALIIILETPAPEFGGFLEMVPDWHKISQIYRRDAEKDVLPLVERLRELNLVQIKTHVTGDAYLLRADQCLHAVAPLKGEQTKRSILNMAFELEPNKIRSSRTAKDLFKV